MTSPFLQEPSFLILTALAAGPQHGYGIMTDVASISGDRIKLRPGTLYAALDRCGPMFYLQLDGGCGPGNVRSS